MGRLSGQEQEKSVYCAAYTGFSCFLNADKHSLASSVRSGCVHEQVVKRIVNVRFTRREQGRFVLRIEEKRNRKNMGHMEEIKDYWNLRANGFSLAVEEELKTEVGVRWKKIFQEYIKKEHANVLDDGTGAGFFPVILSSLGHCVTAIDYSDEMVEQAKKRFADHGLTVKVQQMDAQHLQFADESFDAIVSRNVLWNLDDPAEAYREMYRVLKPGGTILVEDGNMYLYLHDKDYAKLHDQYVEKQKKKRKADVSLHGKYNVDNVDFSVIEKIAEELPMSCRRRPQWDFDQLVQLGFTDIRVEIQGGALPMGFLIAARKAEVQLG